MSFSRTFIYQAVDKVTPTLNKISARMDNVSKKMSGIGRSMSMKVTAPVVAGFATIIYQGAKFEDAMASLEAITGLTGKALSGMGKEIMRESERFGIGSADFAKGMELIGSKQPKLLKTPKILLAVASASATMSKAAGQEFPVAADNLLSIMNAFDITGERASEVINILAASSKYGAAQIPYLSEAMKMAAAGSKFAKLELTEVSAALEVAAEKTGLMSSMVGRQFGNAMLRLEAQTKSRFKPSIVGLGQALDNIAKANLGAKAAMKLWGTENIKVANELIRNRQQISELTKKITGTNVAYEQADVRMRVVNQRLARMWVTLKNKLIRAFDLLKPTLIMIIGKVLKLANAIGKFIRENPITTKWILGIAAVLALIGPVLIGIAVAIKAVAISAGVLAVIFSPIGLAIAAIIYSLIEPMTYLYNNWDGVIADIKTLWEGLQEFLMAFAGPVLRALEPIQDAIGAILGGFKSVQDEKNKYSISGALEGYKAVFGVGEESERALPTLGPKALAIQKQMQMQKHKGEIEISFKPEGAIITDTVTHLPENYNLGYNN